MTEEQFQQRHTQHLDLHAQLENKSLQRESLPPEAQQEHMQRRQEVMQMQWMQKHQELEQSFQKGEKNLGDLSAEEQQEHTQWREQMQYMQWMRYHQQVEQQIQEKKLDLATMQEEEQKAHMEWRDAMAEIEQEQEQARQKQLQDGNQKVAVQKDAIIASGTFTDQQKELMELIVKSYVLFPLEKEKLLSVIHNHTMSEIEESELLFLLHNSKESFDAIKSQYVQVFKAADQEYKKILVENVDLAKITSLHAQIKQKMSMFKIHVQEAKEHTIDRPDDLLASALADM